MPLLTQAMAKKHADAFLDQTQLLHGLMPAHALAACGLPSLVPPSPGMASPLGRARR